MTTKLKYTRALFAIMALVIAATSAAAFDGESQYAKLDGARIHYKSYGKGKDALVLIHGWGSNLTFWRDQIPEFAKRNRVIALDLPGHGESDKPQIAYSMDLFANAIDAVLRDAKVERAVVVGHSDGGLRPFGTKEMREQFMAMFRGPNYKEAGAQMFAQMMPTLPAADQERVKTSFLNTPQHVLVSAMESMSQESLYGPDKITVPVLAVLAKSPFWQPDTEQFLRSLAPDLQLQWFEGVSHFLMMEKPKEFNETVIAFLDKKALLK
jgi:pimeloyl-ACP methyl ester carboxylesterase